MQLPSLLLSLAAPPAFAVAKSVTSIAGGAARDFVQAIGAAGSAGAPIEEASAEPTQRSMGEQLETIAGKLRQWLGHHGLGSPFEIDLTLDADGTENFEVAGPEAPQIASLLEQNSTLRSELSRFASGLQAMTAGLTTGAVSLRISDADSGIRAL